MELWRKRFAPGGRKGKRILSHSHDFLDPGAPQTHGVCLRRWGEDTVTNWEGTVLSKRSIPALAPLQLSVRD